MNSTQITWEYAGITYKTQLSIVITSPNPGGSVTITPTLEGTENYDPSIRTMACGNIFGYVTDDGQSKFQSNNAIGAEGSSPNRLLLYEGNFGDGLFHVFACCRVSTVAGGNNDTPDNYLTVVLRNYLEVQKFGSMAGIIAYSDTKFTTLNLVKKSKS